MYKLQTRNIRILISLFCIPLAFCNDLNNALSNSNKKIDIDFAPLKVGNTWIYYSYSPLNNLGTIIRMITVTGNTDSLWFIVYKDSTTSTPPEVNITCDTCINRNNKISCKWLERYFSGNLYKNEPVNVLRCNDSSHLYYKAIDSLHKEFYINNIGLIMYCHYTSLGIRRGDIVDSLISFNNDYRYLYQCINN